MSTEAEAAALELLDGVSFSAVGVHVLQPVAAAPEAAPKVEVVAKPSKPGGGSSRLRPAMPSTSSDRPGTAPVRSYGGRVPKLEWHNRLSSSLVQQAVADATGSGPPTKGGSTSKGRQLPMIPGSAREPYGQSPHTRLSTPGAARHVTRVAPTEVGYGFLDLFEANKLLARAAMAKPDEAWPEEGARLQHVPEPPWTARPATSGPSTISYGS